MENFKKILDDVRRITKEAGDFILKEFKKWQNKEAPSLDGKDIHIPADLASEKIIKKGLIKKYPDFNILAEESGFLNKKSDYTFIVDPLDGTNNFIRHNPFFSISVALVYKNEIISGIIYAPFLQEEFWAQKKYGAFANGKRITVSKNTKVEKSFIVACEGGEKDWHRTAKLYHKLLPETLEIRKLGSAALESAWVASGRADGYITTKIESWDVAAGVLLVQEAGGKVTNFFNKPWDLKKSDLIFSNAKIHKKLLNKVKNI